MFVGYELASNYEIEMQKTIDSLSLNLVLWLAPQRGLKNGMKLVSKHYF